MGLVWYYVDTNPSMSELGLEAPLRASFRMTVRSPDLGFLRPFCQRIVSTQAEGFQRPVRTATICAVRAWLFPAWPPLNPRQQRNQPGAGLGQGAVAQDRVQAAGQEVAGESPKVRPTPSMAGRRRGLLSSGDCRLGIILRGTGQGIMLAANKVRAYATACVLTPSRPCDRPPSNGDTSMYAHRRVIGGGVLAAVCGNTRRGSPELK